MSFFEPVGQFFFEKNRVWLFFSLLSIPFLLMIANLLPRFMLLRETEQSIDTAALHGRAALEKRVEKEKFLTRYTQCEPYFIDHYLESFPLLQTNLNELQIKLNEAMMKLSEPHRMVVTMFDIQGMSHGEIAKVLKTSEGTIRSRLHYAHLQLQSALQDSWEERF